MSKYQQQQKSLFMDVLGMIIELLDFITFSTIITLI